MDFLLLVGGGEKSILIIFTKDYLENTMFNIKDSLKTNIENINYSSN